jgi:hypothetical protein
VRKIRHAVMMLFDLARILWNDATGRYHARA